MAAIAAPGEVLLPPVGALAAAALITGVAGPRLARGDGLRWGRLPETRFRGGERRRLIWRSRSPSALPTPSLFLYREGGRGSPALDVALRFTQAGPRMIF